VILHEKKMKISALNYMKKYVEMQLTFRCAYSPENEQKLNKKGGYVQQHQISLFNILQKSVIFFWVKIGKKLLVFKIKHTIVT